MESKQPAARTSDRRALIDLSSPANSALTALTQPGLVGKSKQYEGAMSAGRQGIVLIVIAVVVALGACTAGAVWGAVQGSGKPYLPAGPQSTIVSIQTFVS